ncbi:MAG: hypothetical protein WEA56_03540 [Balneolaceae bacterium]
MKIPKKSLKLTRELLYGVEMAMDDHGFEMEWYLDLEKEETTFISYLYDDGEETEALREQIENDTDEKRFIPIPAKPSHEGWEQMEAFILGLDDQDEKTRNLLLTTIQGNGAFRRFKDAIHSIGVAQRWFDHKGRQDRREALEWLLSLDFITAEDVEKGMQLYEETLAKRKQRQEDMVNMKAGRQVRCSDDHGHADKLTIGKVYDILAEQKEHRNIRMKDDRGKTVWMPKSHFELI